MQVGNVTSALKSSADRCCSGIRARCKCPRVLIVLTEVSSASLTRRRPPRPRRRRLRSFETRPPPRARERESERGRETDDDDDDAGVPYRAKSLPRSRRLKGVGLIIQEPLPPLPTTTKGRSDNAPRARAR